VSDIVDVANQIAEEAVARALANRAQNEVLVRPVDCVECGDPIEEKRREVVAGTEHCAECAKYFAERDRLFNGGR
jgi:phage/conjugal plasmid C-4 type zinc finger TraR family protein